MCRIALTMKMNEVTCQAKTWMNFANIIINKKEPDSKGITV